jgi:tetratricopeptide (TPR) repeat protein
MRGVITGYRYVLLICMSGALLPLMQAQKPVNTERELATQEVFIDATQQRILGNLEEAAEGYQEVLRQDRTNAAAAYELGRVYANQEQFTEAMEYAEQAAKYAPENTWYQKFLADMYQENRRYRAAADIYQQLTRDTPNDSYLYYKWAYFLVLDEQYDEAIEVYDQLEKQQGLTEELARRRHTLFLGTGDIDQATQELKRLSDAYPTNIDYLHLLASFLEQAERKEAAITTYERILKLDPNDSKATLALAGKTSANQNDIEFLRSLQDIFSNPSVDLDGKIKQLIPFVQKVADTSDPELAETTLNLTGILIDLHPDEAKVYALAGDLNFYAGQLEAAVENYQQTLDRDDSVYSVWEQLLYALYRLGRYEEMIDRSEEALDLFPNQAVLYFLNGLAYEQEQQPLPAINSLQQALFMSANNPRMQADVLARMGMAYHQMDRFEQADKSFDQALEKAPDDPYLLDTYAYLLADRNERLPAAEKMIRQALDLLPNEPRFLDTYGWIAYQSGDLKKAGERLKEALEKGGETDPLLLEHYGDWLFKTEGPDAALPFWEKALQMGSRSEVLEKKIADKQLYE